MLRRFISTVDETLVKRAMLFPGQAAQYVGMGSDIYQEFPVAQQTFEEARQVLGSSFIKVMFDGPLSDLTLTVNAQPAILSHSIALLRYLGMDVKSSTFALGHSLGEYTALVASGSLKFADALQLVKRRGELMQAAVAGQDTCMKALVFDSKYLEEIKETMVRLQRSLPEGQVADIANINSKNQIVLSGTRKGVDYANSVLYTRGIASRAVKLPVSACFHSTLMLPAQKEMSKHITATNFKMPVIDVISNVTAKPYTSIAEIKENLIQQITKTVLWDQSIRYAQYDGVNEWVLIGPSKVLANLLKKQCPFDIIRLISSLDELIEYSNGVKSEKSFNHFNIPRTIL